MTDTNPKRPSYNSPVLSPKVTIGLVLSFACMLWMFVSLNTVLDDVLSHHFPSGRSLTTLVAFCLCLAAMIWTLVPAKDDTLAQDASGTPRPRFFGRFIPAFLTQVLITIVGLLLVYWFVNKA